jgi:hypothetical protein
MARIKPVITLLSIYAVCVALACALWKYQAWLTGCYVVMSIMLFRRWHAASDVVFYAPAFVLGPLGEVLAVGYGAWSYARPFYFIPAWLPFLWGIAILVVKNLSEILLKGPPPLENQRQGGLTG